MAKSLYNNQIEYEFDEAKDASNHKKHSVPLTDAEGFEWESAVVREDTRKQYSEPRWYLLHRQYKDPKPAQAALRSRFLWGVGPKAPDCGRRISPQKPSQTPFISKPPDFFGFSSEP